MVSLSMNYSKGSAIKNIASFWLRFFLNGQLLSLTTIADFQNAIENLFHTVSRMYRKSRFFYFCVDLAVFRIETGTYGLRKTQNTAGFLKSEYI